MNARELRMRFAIDFASLDLDRLKDWEWFRRALKRFLWGALEPEYRSGDVIGEPPEGEISVSEVRQLQQDVHMALTQMLERTAPGGYPVPVVRGPIQFYLAQPPDARAARAPGMLVVTAERFSDAFLLVLYTVFAQAKSAPLVRACPECRQLFFRVRKQRFCSPRCTDRSNKRTWRQSEAGLSAERKRKRERYQARQRARHGAKVRIGPRKKEKPS